MSGTPPRATQARERLAKGPAWEAHDLVFAGRRGQPLDAHNLTRSEHHDRQGRRQAPGAFKTILAAAGLAETFRLYDLRHSTATLLLSAGENPKVVAERLGHASVTLTMDTYSHVLPTMQEQATERLEAMLYGGSA